MEFKYVVTEFYSFILTIRRRCNFAYCDNFTKTFLRTIIVCLCRPDILIYFDLTYDVSTWYIL